jgi:hypothetical protein
VMTSRRLRRALSVLLVVLVALVAVGASGLTATSAQADPSVAIDGTIDGTPLAGSSAAHPVVLRPDQPVSIDLAVTNDGADPVTLHSVRLTGVVVGLTFFAYQTSVNLTVDPGQSTHLRYALDVTGLEGQATGLIPARISVTDSDRHEVASQAFVSEVRGSLNSVYGLFGLLLLALTIVAIASAAWAIATHRMPRNRWRRGLRLLTVGVGLGLVLVFTLSAFQVWVPSPGRWLMTMLVMAGIFFVIGYLTPTPEADDDEEIDESEFVAAETPAGDVTP